MAKTPDSLPDGRVLRLASYYRPLAQLMPAATASSSSTSAVPPISSRRE
jgi:hypothetical protein